MTPRTNRPAVAIVGGGIIGIAVAREVLRRFPDARVTVFEKSDRVAAHQTGHNSGVVHAGLYYVPGSLKARLCRRGVELLRAVCAERDVPYEACGKVVVALDETERARLDDIHRRAEANGVPGIRLLDAGALREVEPGVVGVAALHSPATAIVDYAALTRTLADDVRDAGGRIRFGAEVARIVRIGADRVEVELTSGERAPFDAVIACAGLQSDRLARNSGGDRDPTIVPFFGQYLILDAEHHGAVRGLVYPVPDPRYPFLGVHVTKRIDGSLMIGPNAFLSLAREAYAGTPFSMRDAVAVAADGGFWRFASRNMPAAWRELRGVASRRRFVEGAVAYVPGLAGATGRMAPRGVRAQAMRRDGTLVDDFAIERVGRAMFVRNAPSPGATSSLAIAEYLVDEAADLFADAG